MRKTPRLNIFDVRINPGEGPVRKRDLPKDDFDGSVPVKTLWGYNDEFVVTGNDNGNLYVWDTNSLDMMNKNETDHKGQINDMQVTCVVKVKYPITPCFQLSKDQTMLVTASKDTTAKLFDAIDLKHLKTYKSNAPVNSAAIRCVCFIL